MRNAQLTIARLERSFNGGLNLPMIHSAIRSGMLRIRNRMKMCIRDRVYDGALSDINHRMGDKRLLTLSFSSPVENGKLSVFGRVRENKDLTAVLEIPKERIKETASQMLSLFPVDDFTVTEVPLEESIARIFTGEVAG